MIDPTTLILTLALSILIFISISFFYHQPRKTKTPCPNSYPIIGNLPGLLLNRRRFHDWVAEMLSSTPSSTLHVKSFLNLSNGICTANPINIQHLLVTNFTNYVKGSRFHSVLEELLGHGIFNVDNELWNVQRKIASHEFSTKSLKHFISDMVSSEVTTRLIPFLTRTCNDETSVIDLQEVLQKFTFDNICNLAFGVDMGCLDIDKESQMSFVKAFDYAVDNCSSRFLCPLPMIWKLKRFLNIGTEKKFKDSVRVIDNFAMNIICMKEKDDNLGVKKQDLLSRFMNCDIEFQSLGHKRKFLRDILISFILAGKDSTSTALTWFFWLMAGHPQCAAKIRAEIMAVAAPGGIFDYDELKSFHYLHAALSESMRLFPPVPIDSRLTMHDDVLPDGTKVCKGWFADYSAYAVGRNEKVWGSDCREFKPERWLDDGRTFKPCDSLRFPVFHSGPRLCLGKDMAYVQMKFIVAAVMANFEVLPVDGGATADRMMQPPYTLSLLLKMRDGLQVRLKRLAR